VRGGFSNDMAIPDWEGSRQEAVLAQVIAMKHMR